MQFTKIMIAVAALAAGSSSFAAPASGKVAISAGASAIRNNFFLNTGLGASALKARCVGTYTVLGAGNFRSAICSNTAVTNANYAALATSSFVDFTGLGVSEVRINTEGSFSAVLLLNSAAAFAQNSTGINGANPAVWDPAANAASTIYPAGAKIVGGFIDVEPLAFPASTIGLNRIFPSTAAGFAQTFGVIASLPLYTKMFSAQQASGFIPVACSVGDTGIASCVPSIGKSQMTSIMAGNEFGAAYASGVGFLTRVAGDSGIELRYARRVDNSGTQAAAQNYFLGLPCSGTSAVAVVAEPTSNDEAGGLKDKLLSAIRVMAAPGTGDVLNEANSATNFVVGVVSGENNQTGQTWRWLRMQGAPIGENAQPSSPGITNADKSYALGLYDFGYETVYSGGSVVGNNFFAAVTATVNTLVASVGLIDNATVAAGFSRNGNSCQFPTTN